MLEALEAANRFGILICIPTVRYKFNLLQKSD